MSQSYKNSDIGLLEFDFDGLPLRMRNFVGCIYLNEMHRVQIHSLFVMLGLCSAAPDTQETLVALSNHQLND